MEPSGVVTADDLRNRFRGVPTVMVADRVYAPMPFSWFFHDMAEEFSDFKREHGMQNWYETHDCDDKSFTWAMFLRWRWHEGYAPEIKAEAPACGVVWYMTDDGGGHSIGWCITDKGDLAYYEPQTDQMARLSLREVRSRWFVYA